MAETAAACGVEHLVYSSANAAGETTTGVGHFDTKSEIERYIRTLAIRSTIIRPSAFMEILTLPGMGLDRGEFTFFMRPDQPMQFIAVEDIGTIVMRIFADPSTFAARTIEIASEAVTGTALVEKFSRIAGRTVTYHRFPDGLLKQNGFLRRLADLVEQGRLAGNADIEGLRREFPRLTTIDDWLAGKGHSAFLSAMRSSGSDVTLR